MASKLSVWGWEKTEIYLFIFSLDMRKVTKKEKSVWRRQQFGLIKGSIIKGICGKLKSSYKARSESHLILR